MDQDAPRELLMDGPCLVVIYSKEPIPQDDEHIFAEDPRVADRVDIDRSDKTLWISARRYGSEVARPHGYDRLTEKPNWVMAERHDRYLIIMRVHD